MKIIGIVCAGLDGSIGKDNDLVWRSKKDFQQVKKETSGHSIFMGRKTFESLPNGPLSNRLNLVLTRDPEKFDNIEGKLYFVKDVNEAITISKFYEKEKMFVFGGSEVYSMMYNLNLMKELLLTKVLEYRSNADTFLDKALLDENNFSSSTRIDLWEERGVLYLLMKIVYK